MPLGGVIRRERDMSHTRRWSHHLGREGGREGGSYNSGNESKGSNVSNSGKESKAVTMVRK